MSEVPLYSVRVCGRKKLPAREGAKIELANMRGRVVREGRSQLARNGFRVGERICGGVRCRGALTL